MFRILIPGKPLPPASVDRPLTGYAPYILVTRRGSMVPVLIVAATTDARGRLYAILSGFKSTDGATLIRIADDGSVDREWRCSLPNANGRDKLMPSGLTISGSQLFVTGGTDMVAAYSLDEQ